jgi:hypothetical protein
MKRLDGICHLTLVVSDDIVEVMVFTTLLQVIKRHLPHLQSPVGFVRATGITNAQAISTGFVEINSSEEHPSVHFQIAVDFVADPSDFNILPV